ncbi:MAG: M20/M25/M40 family metallo-hydrolase, partial [Elusimicrobia bacterium]|nr:M20/M25/M40 family metallo-hydrolase [Elusimicrobiota bacterium]
MIGAVELLQDLVRIPSPSGQEDAVVARLEDAFRGLGWTPERRGRNLTALLDGGDGPLLLLNSHTDTVPVGAEWTKDPLAAKVEDGRIYGRGTNDAKGCLTAMILGAAKAFASDAPKGKVLLAASCEEEVLGQGLEKLLPQLPRPDAAVVGEPTGLRPAVAQKGLIVLELFAAGRSAHAAHGGGVNAIEAAARDVLALSKVRFDAKHPVLGATTLAVTQIAGGDRHNVIPDRCKLVVDVRTTPDLSVDEIVARVKAAVESEVRVRSSRLGSVETDPAHPVVRAALSANPAAKPYGSPTLSDWVFLKGIPTVKVGPGDS